MKIVYRYTRNKNPLSSIITKDQIFYEEEVPKFCSCNQYIRYSESRKLWMEINTDGFTIIKEDHTCRYIPPTKGVSAV